MSRIGKKPIAIPSGVEVKVDGGKIVVKKGAISQELDTLSRVGVALDGSVVTLTLNGETSQDKAYWGTYRALLANIIGGLDQGFKKVLEINGVGYKAAINGSKLEMALGYSHPVIFEIPAGIEMAVEKNTITIKGYDKQQVGQVAAKIREFRPPEPYKGKGIKYSDEKIIRKAGKTSKK